MNDGFPSPMGIFFVSILDGKMERVHEWVSAPYGDLFYFYMKNIYRKALDEEFPSPLGIFFISIGYYLPLQDWLDEFPSPLGIFFISMALIYYHNMKYDLTFPSPLGIFFISIVCFL